MADRLCRRKYLRSKPNMSVYPFTPFTIPFLPVPQNPDNNLWEANRVVTSGVASRNGRP